MLHIVLIEPEIPQNTGNIARTCAATGSTLHLVGKLGFEISDKQVKRAGLDYWHLVRVLYHSSFEELAAAYPEGSFWFASTKSGKVYSEVAYDGDCFLVFGPETRGLDERLLAAHYDRCVRIPMVADSRSLNLGNAVAVITYEALRQQGFEGLKTAGSLSAKTP